MASNLIVNAHNRADIVLDTEDIALSKRRKCLLLMEFIFLRVETDNKQIYNMSGVISAIIRQG